MAGQEARRLEHLGRDQAGGGLLSLDAVVRVVKETAASFTRISIEAEDASQRHNAGEELMHDISVVLDELPCGDAVALACSLGDALVPLSPACSRKYAAYQTNAIKPTSSAGDDDDDDDDQQQQQQAAPGEIV